MTGKTSFFDAFFVLLIIFTISSFFAEVSREAERVMKKHKSVLDILKCEIPKENNQVIFDPLEQW
jgi:preprotein translocase subunit YajC